MFKRARVTGEGNIIGITFHKNVMLPKRCHSEKGKGIEYQFRRIERNNCQAQARVRQGSARVGPLTLLLRGGGHIVPPPAVFHVLSL